MKNRIATTTEERRLKKDVSTLNAALTGERDRLVTIKDKMELVCVQLLATRRGEFDWPDLTKIPREVIQDTMSRNRFQADLAETIKEIISEI